MAQTLFGNTNSSGDATEYAFSATAFFRQEAMSHIQSGDTQTEATNQRRYHPAGTLVGLASHVSSNTFTTTTCTFQTRINGAGGNLITSYAAGVTGWVTDTSHSDAVSDDQKVCAVVNTGTDGLKIITSTAINLAYSATSGTAVPYGWASGPPGSTTTLSTASQTYYIPLCGWGSGTASYETSESSQSKQLLRAAGTLQDLQVYMLTNSNTNAATLTSRKNGGAGNQTVSITASTTGFFEDTSHSDTIAGGDVANYLITTGAATVNCTVHWIGCTFIPTGTNQDMLAGLSPNVTGLPSGGTNYLPAFGYFGTSTTESSAQCKALMALNNIGRARINVYSNSSATCTMVYRANGSTGNETVSITGSTNGTFEDSSHTDTAAQGDTMGFMVTGTTNTVGVNWTGLTTDTTPVVTGRARRGLCIPS